MRRIAFLLMVLGFVASPGCTLVRDVLFEGFERHYTDGSTPEERRQRFRAQLEQYESYPSQDGEQLGK